MQKEFAYISEKFDSLSISANASRMLRQEYERRRENEKVMAGEFKSLRTNDSGIDYRHFRMDDTYHLYKDDYTNHPLPPGSEEKELYTNRPLPPLCNPIRSPVLSSVSADFVGHSFDAVEMGFPSPPGYMVGPGKKRSGSRPPFHQSEVEYGTEKSAIDSSVYEERNLRRERAVYERGG